MTRSVTGGTGTERAAGPASARGGPAKPLERA